MVAGHSASALHGARWIDANRPAELIYGNRHAPPLIRTWSDRIEDDEKTSVGDLSLTNPARTALDLACRYPIVRSVPRWMHSLVQRLLRWLTPNFSRNAISVAGASVVRVSL